MSLLKTNKQSWGISSKGWSHGLSGFLGGDLTVPSIQTLQEVAPQQCSKMNKTHSSRLQKQSQDKFHLWSISFFEGRGAQSLGSRGCPWLRSHSWWFLGTTLRDWTWWAACKACVVNPFLLPLDCYPSFLLPNYFSRKFCSIFLTIHCKNSTMPGFSLNIFSLLFSSQWQGQGWRPSVITGIEGYLDPGIYLFWNLRFAGFMRFPHHTKHLSYRAIKDYLRSGSSLEG